MSSVATIPGSVIRVIKADSEPLARVVVEGPQGPVAQLPSNVALTDEANSFGGIQTFGGVVMNGELSFPESDGEGFVKFTTGLAEDRVSTYSICHPPSTPHDLTPAGNPGWLLTCTDTGGLSWMQLPDALFQTRKYGQAITGTQDGTNNSFTFGGSDTVVTNTVALFRGGVRQLEGTDYSVNYTTKELSFSPILEAGEVVQLDYTKEGI